MNRNQPAGSMQSPWRGFHTLLTIVIVVAPVLALQLFSLGVFRVSASGPDHLPVSIRAASEADYSRDTQSFVIPPINESILYELLRDASGAVSTPGQTTDLPLNPTATAASSSGPEPTSTVEAATPTATPTGPLATVTALSSVTPLSTATPRIVSSPTTAAGSTPTSVPSTPVPNTPAPPEPIDTVVSLPTAVPPVLQLPTLPPILPTILAPVETAVPPLIPTLLSELPTLPPLLP